MELVIIDMSCDSYYKDAGQYGDARSPTTRLSLSDHARDECVRLYNEHTENDDVKIFADTHPKTQALQRALSSKISPFLLMKALVDRLDDHPDAKIIKLTTALLPVGEATRRLSGHRSGLTDSRVLADANLDGWEVLHSVQWPEGAVQFEFILWKPILSTFHTRLTELLRSSRLLNKKIKAEQFKSMFDDIEKLHERNGLEPCLRNRILANLFRVCFINENVIPMFQHEFLENVLRVVNKQAHIKTLVNEAAERNIHLPVTEIQLRNFIDIDANQSQS